MLNVFQTDDHKAKTEEILLLLIVESAFFVLVEALYTDAMLGEKNQVDSWTVVGKLFLIGNDVISSVRTESVIFNFIFHIVSK